MLATTLRTTAFATLLATAGCSAHHPLIVQHTTDVAYAGEQRPAPHQRAVLVTASALPAQVEYEPLAQIDVGRAWYASTERIHDELAARARALGADAVIEVQTWHQPSGFAWWAPHGRGTAVRITGGIGATGLEELGPLR